MHLDSSGPYYTLRVVVKYGASNASAVSSRTGTGCKLGIESDRVRQRAWRRVSEDGDSVLVREKYWDAAKAYVGGRAERCVLISIFWNRSQ